MARLRLFAALREAAGRDRDEIDAPSVGLLLEEARRRYGAPFVNSLKFASVAVNGVRTAELQGDETPLTNDDEVALLPPVSGGSSEPNLLGFALGTLALLSSWLGPESFLGFAGLVLVLGAVELARIFSRSGLHVSPALVGAATAVFPAAGFLWGEGGLIAAGALAVIGAGASFILRGLRPGATGAVAATLFACFYLGFLGSYAVLARRADTGAVLVGSFVLILALYRAGRWVARRLHGQPEVWAGPLGLAGSLAGAGASRFLLGLPL
ncbi:MAG: MoaD/ThiS family protein, partial [Actinomycetota bacterium]